MMVSDPLKLELKAFVIHLMWMLGTNSGPLQEQQAFLTTELSYQPLARVLILKSGICGLFLNCILSNPSNPNSVLVTFTSSVEVDHTRSLRPVSLIKHQLIAG